MEIVVFVAIASFLFFDLLKSTEGNGVLLRRIYNVVSKNRLYKCSSCERLFRDYQCRKIKKGWQLERVIKCPHCDDEFASSGAVMKRKSKWMDFHPDSPRVSMIGFIKFKRMFKRLKKNKQALKDQEYFEEYNNLHVDVKWIENLTKK